MNANASPGWIRDVTEESFEADVLQESVQRPVIVDFWAPWCAPCRMLGPVLEKLINERQGDLILAKVNTEEAPQLSAYFRVQAIPAVKIFSQGRLIYEFEGVLPESQLRELFNQLSPAALEREEAEQALVAEQADPAAAERHYREAIEKDPEKHDARLGLARVLFEQQRFDEVADTLEPVGSAGEAGASADAILAKVRLARMAEGLARDTDLRHRSIAEPKNALVKVELGTVLAATGAYEEALATLLAAAELDFNLAPGKVREVMVQIFYAIGASHPLANEYRTKLARLLY